MQWLSRLTSQITTSIGPCCLMSKKATSDRVNWKLFTIGNISVDLFTCFLGRPNRRLFFLPRPSHSLCNVVYSLLIDNKCCLNKKTLIWFRLYVGPNGKNTRLTHTNTRTFFGQLLRWNRHRYRPIKGWSKDPSCAFGGQCKSQKVSAHLCLTYNSCEKCCF